ncbi:MAG: hypothetical protein COS08_00830 [Euryarchaeota archaeon CG01_land_8_20_14_3_00_38_12]|nr:MAG: hypothetical protein COS08_00830 [Euryarchaeota archaeon CG01_land_8_20_14_3_00_38_12]PJB21726.1 MAG: hypothetical protein CO114_03805 [Euryarchaeota archaeon CG_4_9_14_3_um_filter_38_12]
MKEGYTRRDYLAQDRTYLANERTLLAYWRTSLAFFCFRSIPHKISSFNILYNHSYYLNNFWNGIICLWN